jgi:hypothetical protein
MQEDRSAPHRQVYRRGAIQRKSANVRSADGMGISAGVSVYRPLERQYSDTAVIGRAEPRGSLPVTDFDLGGSAVNTQKNQRPRSIDRAVAAFNPTLQRRGRVTRQA